MKSKSKFVFISLLFFSLKNFSQEIKMPKMCKPQLDSVMLREVMLADAIKWSETKPLQVGCDEGNVFVLYRFDISIFTLKPMQTIEYGTGEKGGIPILAQNAIKRAKAGDTVILKNAVYIDANGKEQKLPVISFKMN